MIYSILDQVVSVDNLNELNKVKAGAREGHDKSEKILNEKEHKPGQVATITYIVSNKDKKTILATIKNEDDWKNYKSLNIIKLFQNQLQKTIKDRRKGKFVLLNTTKAAKPNPTPSEDNSLKENPEKKLPSVSPEDWLAQFYSTDVKYQRGKEKPTPSPAKMKIEMKSIKSTNTTKGKVLTNFEQLLLKSPSRLQNISEKSGQVESSPLNVFSGERNERRPVRKSEPVAVHLIPANQVEKLLTYPNRRQSNIETPLDSYTEQLPSIAKPQTSWRSSDSQRWRPVFTPSQREERRRRL